MFTLKVCIFSMDFKCLDHVFIVIVNKDLCCLDVTTSFFCNPIVHTICGVHALSITSRC